MRICHLSTFWPHRHGHTHYTDGLIRGMRAHEATQHVVAAEYGSDSVTSEELRVIPCFGRDGDYVEGVVGVVDAVGAEVAIVQYSNDLFGDDERFPRLIRRLRERGVATVVNSHSIYPPSRRTALAPAHDAEHFDRAVAEHADCMLVHSQRMRQQLLDRGIPIDRTAIIPHGTTLLAPPSRRESRRLLGIADDAKVVLFFGFVWLGKGLDFLLDVFATVARRLPAAHLYVGGSTEWDPLYARAYMVYLRARAWRLGLRRRVTFSSSYVPDELVPTLYGAADVVALPYRQAYASVSGVVHQAAGMGRPMLCSRIAKFDEVEQISRDLVVGERDLDGWSRALERLLTDEVWREELRRRIARFAVDTRWEAVGDRHLQLCRAVLARRALLG
jgi:glycosyltransferase involved in cell wall biosynthesis